MSRSFSCNKPYLILEIPPMHYLSIPLTLHLTLPLSHSPPLLFFIHSLSFPLSFSLSPLLTLLECSILVMCSASAKNEKVTLRDKVTSPRGWSEESGRSVHPVISFNKSYFSYYIDTFDIYLSLMST
eukprot:sb/3475431/